jgi:hypothetical protein
VAVKVLKQKWLKFRFGFHKMAISNRAQDNKIQAVVLEKAKLD